MPIHRHEQAHHVVSGHEIRVGEAGGVPEGPALVPHADPRQEVRHGRVASRRAAFSLRRRAQEAQQDLAAHVLARLVDALQRVRQWRTLVLGHHPRGRGERVAGGGDGLCHDDPAGPEQLREDLGRVARRILEGDRQRLGARAERQSARRAKRRSFRSCGRGSARRRSPEGPSRPWRRWCSTKRPAGARRAEGRRCARRAAARASRSCHSRRGRRPRRRSTRRGPPIASRHPDGRP